MRKTYSHDEIKPSEKIMVDTNGLTALLSCGKGTAVKIGTDANARVKIGTRVLWNVRNVQKYIDSISGKIITDDEMSDEDQELGKE